MSVKRIRTAATGLLATVALTMTAFGGLSSSAEAIPDQPPVPDRGCPEGAACIYPDDSWNNGNPSHIFWSYGVHRIYDQYGDHRIYNHQTDDATIQLCIGSDGTDCTYIPAGWTKVYDLTIINSVALQPI